MIRDVFVLLRWAIRGILERVGVINTFDTNVVPRGVYTTYEIGGGWGNHIGWQTSNSRVVGHMPKNRFPERGDFVTSGMASGKTGVFRITGVDRCDDPSDMFFAYVVPVCYTDEVKLVEPNFSSVLEAIL